MEKKVNQLKEGHSVVEDKKGNGYVLDFSKCDFFEDKEDTEYEVFPIKSNGDVLYDAPITMTRGELTAKWTRTR